MKYFLDDWQAFIYLFNTEIFSKGD